MKYEIYTARDDVEERLHCTFQAESDEKALAIFEMYKHSEELSWDFLRLVKVIQERVTENIATRIP